MCKKISCMLAVIMLFTCAAGFGDVTQVFAAQPGRSEKENIMEIQQRLSDWGYLQGEADGIFGRQTEAAVLKFQKVHGLKEDGKVGKQTLRSLGLSEYEADLNGSVYANRHRQKALPISITEEEKILLAKAIEGEARGEDYQGKVAVGAVILNRTQTPGFPSTIKEVLYQPGAFCIVSNGQINRRPSDSSIEAAEEALRGADPTGGSLYFWNPKISTSKWIRTREVVAVIGNHCFGV